MNCLRDAADLLVDGDWIETKDQDPSGGVRLIQLADIGCGSFLNRSSRFLTMKKAEGLSCTFLAPGDVLIARMPDPIGRACVFPDLGQTCITAVDVAILRPKAGVNAHYLVNWINQPAFLDLVLREAKGATRKRISRRNLEQLPIRLRSEAEQCQIVTRIKNCMERVDEIQSLRAACNKEMPKIARSFYRDTYLSLLSHRESTPLIGVGRVSGGGTPSTKESEFWDGSIPWVSPKDMKRREIDSTIDTISEAALSGSAVKLIETPSVLFVVRGMILAHTLPVAVNRVPVTINQDMKAITPNSDFLVDYIAAMLRGAESELLGSVEIAGHGTRRLQTARWENLPIPLLSLDEQSEIVDRVEEFERQVAILHESSPNQEVAILRESILQKAFAGDI